MIKNFLEWWREWKRNRRMTFTCKACGAVYNVEKQTTVCPHLPVSVWIRSLDHASKNGDYSVETVAQMMPDGTMKVLSSKVIKRGEDEEKKEK